jgi:2-polyprenyl-3-methyl-5-hydroxy-6-metoxy-1,4-benzoquinol methylase
MYSKLTVDNNSAIKRFTHNRRFALAIDLLNCNACNSVLDYGTGDGYFLISLKNKCPNVVAFGYEPEFSMFEQLLSNLHYSNCVDKISVLQSLDELSGKKFERITCFEVLEHLDKNMQKKALQNMKKFLKQDGLLVISIPIEVGFSSLIKNILRLILGQKHDATNMKNIIKAFWGIPIERESLLYIPSHIGFNFHDLEKIFLEEDLIVAQKYYSPFKYFGSIINSQVFYLLSVK